MHPARLILSTGVTAVPGPDARVGLPKKDPGGGPLVADGMAVGGGFAGVFVIPTAASTNAVVETNATPAERTSTNEPDGGSPRRSARAGEGPLLFGGQCLSSPALKDHGGKGRTLLQAQCVDEAGQWWQTSLNLNRCIGADDGELVYQESGDFDSLCWPCVIVDSHKAPHEGDAADSLTLECTCLDRLGSPKRTTLQLGPQAEHSHAVGSYNGRLVCGAHEGDRMPLV